MTTQAPPNCNISLTNGEFFSIKENNYKQQIVDNDKQKKIFYLGLGVNILFFIILTIVGLVLLNKNKTAIATSDNKDNIALTSPWSTGVIICLGVGILCLLSVFFTGYKSYSLGKQIDHPTIDDNVRPCYSTSRKEILQPVTLSGSGSSGIRSTITGSNLGQAIRDQTLAAQTGITQSGLNQPGIDPSTIEVSTGASQHTNNMGSGSQTAGLDTTGTGSNFTFNQNQTSTNQATSGATSSGNKGKDSDATGSSSATSGTSGNTSVQLYT